MDWRGRRSSRRRSRTRFPAPRFEWLEDRLAPAVAVDVGPALPEWLVDEPTETLAEIWSEDAPQDQFLFDQNSQVGPESVITLDDFSWPANDAVDALAFTTLDTSFDAAAVDHVLTTAENDSGEDGRTDPAEEFRKLAALAPAILEAVFPRQETRLLLPEFGSRPSSPPVMAPRAASPSAPLSATIEAFKLDSALYGVGSAIDEPGQDSWHTSLRQDAAPMSSDPMAPASEPMSEPVPQPMTDARQAESSAATVLAAAGPAAEQEAAEKDVVAVAETAERQQRATPRPAAASLVPARGGFTAALLVWCLLLVAQLATMRPRRCVPSQVVRQRLPEPLRPPDPGRRREQRKAERKADSAVCLFCCAGYSEESKNWGRFPAFHGVRQGRNSCEFRYGKGIACPV
jgi:hypothetical protein